MVAKRSKAGEWEWMRSGGTANNDLGLAIDLDSNGNVFVTGYLGGVSWPGSSAGFDGGAVTATASNGGGTFVAQIDIDGEWTWAVMNGNSNSAGSSRGDQIVVDSNGDAYVSGICYYTCSYNTNDGNQLFSLTTGSNNGGGYIAKINSSGVWQWVEGAAAMDSDQSQ